LWRSLRFPLPVVPRILSACMRIHNFCIDQKVPPITAAIDAATKSATEEAFVAWWNNAEEPRDHDSQQGRRTDLGSIKKRDGLADLLHRAGIHRPTSAA
jgi:hypothetical protein